MSGNIKTEQKYDPMVLAHKLRRTLTDEISAVGKINIRGIIATNQKAANIYAQYAKEACAEVGINFDLLKCERTEVERAIIDSNADHNIHGIFLYYPVFNTDFDTYLKDLIDLRKDIEGLNVYWTRKLSLNDPYAVAGDKLRPSITPCTPQAILEILKDTTNLHKMIREGGLFTIFNRSEVVGRPLALLLKNMGARVHSYDLSGCMVFDREGIREVNNLREDSLIQSSVVITGIPDQSFKKITFEELGPVKACLNFSAISNFEEDVAHQVPCFIPRVGPITVTMAIKNALTLFKNFHQ